MGGWTALMYAVVSKQKNVVKLLLAKNATVDRTNAARKHSLDLCEDLPIRRLLEKHVVALRIPPEDVESGKERPDSEETTDGPVRKLFRVRFENSKRSLPENS